MLTARKAAIRYEVPLADDAWTLPEETVPESQPHDLVLDLLKQILLAWAARTGDAQIARNLAVRWDEARPTMGVDPDLCVIRPRTPEGDELMSLCTWHPGHVAPLVAIEVVSQSNARKDYASAPERYAACGVQELWVFDPALAGPKLAGGPHRLQVWRRSKDGAQASAPEGIAEFERVYAGPGPARSEVLDAFLLVVDEGRKLRLASDDAGATMWLTAEERERTEKERERAEKDRERAEKDRERAEKDRERAENEELRRQLAELEARLAARG